MPNLFTIHDSIGLLGACNERCYDALGPPSLCVCHGANHGLGLQQAARNTIRRSHAWALLIPDRQHPHRPVIVTTNPSIRFFASKPSATTRDAT